MRFYSEDEIDTSLVHKLVVDWVNELTSLIGFILGYAFETEIDYVFCVEDDTNQPVGIERSVLHDRNSNRDQLALIKKIFPKITRAKDVYIKRCIRDLMLALKYRDDSALYCFQGT